MMTGAPKRRMVQCAFVFVAFAPIAARAAVSDEQRALERERLRWIFDSGSKGTLAKEWTRLVDLVRTGPTDQVRLEAARRLVRMGTDRPVPATTRRQKIYDDMAGVGTLETDKVKRALGRIVRDRRAHERARHYARTALEEIACLVSMKQVFSRKGAGTSWKVVIRYLRTGPTERVRYAAADVLAAMHRREITKALVDLATDTEERRPVRCMAMRALTGLASLLQDEDVARILASDEKGWHVSHILLDKVAGKANLGLKQIQAILERYDRPEHSREVAVVEFASTQLKTHKGEKFDREIRPVLEQFLTSAARALGPEQLRRDPNLRWLLARALEENRIPGAVELYVDCLREKLKRRKQGKSFSPLHYVRALNTLTGKSMGYDRKLKGDDPANLKACERWLEWWEANKDDARYKLPEETATEPAAGQDAKAGKGGKPASDE